MCETLTILLLFSMKVLEITVDDSIIAIH